jgi:hypothetical protein
METMMRRTNNKLTWCGVVAAVSMSGSTAMAQLTTQGGTGFGTPQTGATTGQTGTTGLTGLAQNTGATGANGQKLPGSFGGPGITGTPVIEFSNVTASKAFASPSSLSGGGLAGSNNQATGASPFGTNAFGGNATTGAGGANSTQTFGIGNLGGMGRNGGLGGIGGLGGLGGGGGRGNSAQAKNKIRIVVKPEIEADRPNAREPIGGGVKAQARFGRIPMPAKLRGVTAAYDGDAIVLRGEVATESEKRLVERLVKLEPGVDSVRNEVTVLAKSSEDIQAAPNR